MHHMRQHGFYPRELGILAKLHGRARVEIFVNGKVFGCFGTVHREADIMFFARLSDSKVGTEGRATGCAGCGPDVQTVIEGAMVLFMGCQHGCDGHRVNIFVSRI
jgi:hypothetical protein